MSNYFNNKPFKPTKVGIIKAVGKKIGSLIKGKGKVSPTIKSVSPSTTVREKGVKASLDKTRSDEYRKRYTALDKAEGKVKTGKKMMQEGQKERKRMVDTGRAFQFKHSKSFHAVKPGDKDQYKPQMKKPKKEKRFYTGKELEQQDYFNKGKGRDKKMGGGMMGRRFGMKKGTPFKKETNVDKIKKAFPVTKKGLKKIDPEKQKGLAKLKKERPDVVRKMGYFKKGGRS
jgi:Skp family chaperone for outer membrane proteins